MPDQRAVHLRHQRQTRFRRLITEQIIHQLNDLRPLPRAKGAEMDGGDAWMVGGGGGADDHAGDLGK